MKRISETRFNAIAGYARKAMALAMANELEFFQIDNGRIVGMLIQDRTDRDYFGTVFAADALKRMRSVRMTAFVDTLDAARDLLRTEMAVAGQAPPSEFHQGDEDGEPVDFLTPVASKQSLNPDFEKFISQEGYSPAQDIISLMMHWYEDADGNFVEQFQTTGFDQRIWELYLFAAFREMGYDIDRSNAVPDFCCDGLMGSFNVEAVTVGPTKKGKEIIPPPPTDTAEEIRVYLQDYMPIKFGSALYSKLKKKYWEHDHVANKPLVLAIHDFSSPGSMIHSRSALERYVFGVEHGYEKDEQGNLVILPTKIETHDWEDKSIPSGFFDQPDSEHISAILFSNSGTIAKFNRMGILTGFGSGKVVALREGTMVNHDPNATSPKFFKVVVNSEGYEETWTEGLSVIHNPNALKPLDPASMPGAAHLFLEDDGQITSHTPDFFPFGSRTIHFAPVDVDEWLDSFGDKTHMVFTPREEDEDETSPS